MTSEKSAKLLLQMIKLHLYSEGGKGGGLHHFSRKIKRSFHNSRKIKQAFDATRKKGECFSLNKSCIPLHFEKLRSKQSLVSRFTIRPLRVLRDAKRKPSSSFWISRMAPSSSTENHQSRCRRSDNKGVTGLHNSYPRVIAALRVLLELVYL